MRTVKYTEKRPGQPDTKCGCEYAVDRDREVWSTACQKHEAEFIVRHAAAAVSCSHANHDLVS